MWKHLSHAVIVSLRRTEAEAAAYLRHAAMETTWDRSRLGMPLPVTPPQPLVLLLFYSKALNDWQDER